MAKTKEPKQKYVRILRGTRIGTKAAPKGTAHLLDTVDANYLEGCGKAEFLDGKSDADTANKRYREDLKKAEREREAAEAKAAEEAKKAAA